MCIHKMREYLQQTGSVSKASRDHHEGWQDTKSSQKTPYSTGQATVHHLDLPGAEREITNSYFGQNLWFEGFEEVEWGHIFSINCLEV